MFGRKGDAISSGYVKINVLMEHPSECLEGSQAGNT